MSILVVGSLNMDLVTYVDKMPKGGETVNGISFAQYCGGKGANQAIAIGKLNGKVSMLGKVGNDSYGEILLSALKDSNVSSYVNKKDNVSTGIASIIVEESSENRIIIINGANYTFDIKDLHEDEHLFDEAKIILVQLELKMDVIEEIARIAKKKNKILILNPAPYANLSDEILSSITYLTPNETELKKLSGKNNLTSIDDIKDACLMLIKKGVKNVVTTLGKRGALIVNDTMCELIPGFQVKAVDTTAAGDWFNGALAKCIDEGFDLKDAVRYANAAAALSVTKKGAIPSLPSFDEVNKFLNN